MQEMDRIGEESLANFQPKTELPEIEDIPQLLETYNKLEIGKSLLIKLSNPTNDGESTELGAYILPTANELEHLIIMRSGEVYLVEPKSLNPDDLLSYIAFHNPSPIPSYFKVNLTDLNKGLEVLTQHEDSGNLFNNKVILSNKNGPNEQLDDKIDEAVDVALSQRERRIQGKEETRKTLLKKGVNRSNFTPITQESQPVQSQPVDIFPSENLYDGEQCVEV